MSNTSPSTGSTGSTSSNTSPPRSHPLHQHPHGSHLEDTGVCARFHGTTDHHQPLQPPYCSTSSSSSSSAAAAASSASTPLPLPVATLHASQLDDGAAMGFASANGAITSSCSSASALSRYVAASSAHQMSAAKAAALAMNETNRIFGGVTERIPRERKSETWKERTNLKNKTNEIANRLPMMKPRTFLSWTAFSNHLDEYCDAHNVCFRTRSSMKSSSWNIKNPDNPIPTTFQWAFRIYRCTNGCYQKSRGNGKRRHTIRFTGCLARFDARVAKVRINGVETWGIQISNETRLHNHKTLPPNASAHNHSATNDQDGYALHEDMSNNPDAMVNQTTATTESGDGAGLNHRSSSHTMVTGSFGGDQRVLAPRPMFIGEKYALVRQVFDGISETMVQFSGEQFFRELEWWRRLGIFFHDRVSKSLALQQQQPECPTPSGVPFGISTTVAAAPDPNSTQWPNVQETQVVEDFHGASSSATASEADQEPTEEAMMPEADENRTEIEAEPGLLDEPTQRNSLDCTTSPHRKRKRSDELEAAVDEEKHEGDDRRHHREIQEEGRAEDDRASFSDEIDELPHSNGRSNTKESGSRTASREFRLSEQDRHDGIEESTLARSPTARRRTRTWSGSRSPQEHQDPNGVGDAPSGRTRSSKRLQEKNHDCNLP